MAHTSSRRLLKNITKQLQNCAEWINNIAAPLVYPVRSGTYLTGRLPETKMVQNIIKYHRHSIRLKDYDYSQAGAYFITICTHNKKLYLEKYCRLRNIVKKQWDNIPHRFKNVELDEFVIMPNHIHCIIVISFDKFVGATLAVAKNHRAGARPAPTNDFFLTM